MYSKASVYGAADSIKPYVERAMSDEKLRGDVLRAFRTANNLYQDLMSNRDEPVRIAARVATDDDVRDKLRDAIDDLRSASERLQGRRDHSGRNSALLLVGITLGLLYNPITGPETRRFIKDIFSGGSAEPLSDDDSVNGRK
jgi:hypothetical protein